MSKKKRKASVPAPAPVGSAAHLAIGAFALQIVVTGLFLLFALENELISGAFFSKPLWLGVVRTLAGSADVTRDGLVIHVPFASITILSIVLCAVTNLIVTSTSQASVNFIDAVFASTITNTKWFTALGTWTAFWVINMLLPGMPLSLWLIRTVPMAVAALVTGWFYETLKAIPIATADSQQPDIIAPSSRARWSVGTGVAIYTFVFVAMNFALWFNLQIPHGDSSMYEEHLWNTLHGKGFRSYLDQGLFLGEHVQVIHLLLLPIYALVPSHLLLEFFGSAAVAIGAIPVFLMARRHAKSEAIAALLAASYLLYFPLQYLDISIDLKTFRPSAFGIPALLFAFYFAEVRHYVWMAFCCLLALASQEDFATVLAPFGLWLAISGYLEFRQTKSAGARWQMIVGGIMCVAAAVYVVAVVKFVLPWFRSGGQVHYASYFDAFGKTPVEIVINLVTRPDLVFRELVTPATLTLFLLLLQPAGMPLRAWSRLLVGLPLFVLLAANQLTKDFPGPFHHFHAPIIPVVAWAMANSLGIKLKDEKLKTTKLYQRGYWILASAIATSIFFSISPLGIKFWDAGGMFYWHRLYVTDERAKEFEKVLAAIPTSARVASTDFVHPRFTHFERSYDYSHYPRKVADNEDKVPDDTDYIVIDTRHRYSEIQTFEQMREFRDQHDQWEVVPLDTKGYFIVLKRVKYPPKRLAAEAQP